MIEAWRDLEPLALRAEKKAESKQSADRGGADTGNPVHDLIAWIERFSQGLLQVHRATTETDHEHALNGWQATTAPFWRTYRIPDEAEAGLSDRAIAWCARYGLSSREDISVIQRGAEIATRLAMSLPNDTRAEGGRT